MDTNTAIIAFVFLVVSIIAIILIYRCYPKIGVYGIKLEAYELEYEGSWYYTQEEFENIKKFFFVYFSRSRINEHIFDTNDYSIDNTYLLVMTKFIDYLRMSLVAHDPSKADNLLYQLSINGVYDCLCKASSNKKDENIIKDVKNDKMIFMSQIGPFKIQLDFKIVSHEKL